MIYRTHGIVFRTIKFSETSVVSKIYTEKFGMQSYIVNGVRSEKSKTKAAHLQVKSTLGLFMMEVLNKCIHEEQTNETMFAFITDKLQSLDQQQRVPTDYLLK